MRYFLMIAPHGRPYLVEVSRLVNEIENGNAYDISDCKYVTGVSEYAEDFTISTATMLSER